MTEPTTIDAAVAHLLGDCVRVLLAKRRQRGTQNIVRQGMSGVIRRFIEDKYARLAHAGDDLDLVRLWPRLVAAYPGGLPDFVHEDIVLHGFAARATVREEALDVINYCVILLLLERGWWELPDRVVEEFE